MVHAHDTSETPALLAYRQSRFSMAAGLGITLLFHAFFVAWLLIRPRSVSFTEMGDDILEVVAQIIGAVFCFIPVRSADKRPLWNSRSKQVAFFCGMSMITGIVSQSYWICLGLAPKPFHLPRFIPDIISTLSYPLLFAGVWRLPRKPLSMSSQIRISLDGLMVAASALTFSWYFVLGPTILASTRGLERTVVDAMYPLMDVLQIACLLFLGRQTGYLGKVLLLLSVALVISAVADSTYVYTALHQKFAKGTLLDLSWTLASLLTGVAVLTGRQAMEFTKFSDEPSRLPSLWAALLPYALLPPVVALVIYTDQAAGRAILKHGVFWGALALICLILVRQVLALLENREMNGRLEALATTDPLTGLLNHRAFHVRLAEEAARCAADGQTLAVAMLDLDNFKFFNDAYGHAAGDEVLRRVADALRENTALDDTIARFGGDEFALILPLSTVGSARLGVSATGLQQALEASLETLSFQPPGSTVAIPLSVSLGVASFPEEAGSYLEALELADRRLMHFKTGGGADHPAEELCRELTQSLSGFSMLNALVTAVDNKDRYTRRHSEDVLTYSLQIAVALGLGEETRRTVQTAALLHDVGKIGVPDRVLRKPGALTEEEFEAVKQHPLMGAIIVGAVAGFEDTLDAVRHHHERWDGKGYPYGLAGTDTPFLARLISVADAFSAMTTDRPYRKGMDQTKALRILEEGAGTQWDPECVHALLRVYRPAAQCARPMLLAA